MFISLLIKHGLRIRTIQIHVRVTIQQYMPDAIRFIRTPVQIHFLKFKFRLQMDMGLMLVMYIF